MCNMLSPSWALDSFALVLFRRADAQKCIRTIAANVPWKPHNDFHSVRTTTLPAMSMIEQWTTRGAMSAPRPAMHSADDNSCMASAMHFLRN